MKKIPMTELKRMNAMDLRDLLNEHTVLLITISGRPLAELWKPGEDVGRLLQEVDDVGQEQGK